ncbi:MAG: electron transport complex subunit RsxD [Cocleimonas sp.]
MKFKTNTSPFFTSNQTVSREMLQVILALIPGTLVMFYSYGWGVILNVMLAITFAIVLEASVLYLRKRPILPFLSDLSAIVTAWLLALTLPPLAPWWLVFVGILFAIVLAKHLYGGLGYNPFNPAMVGFAVLIISFPFEMSQWIRPDTLVNSPFGLIDSLKFIFSSQVTLEWDAITRATPLDAIKTGLTAGQEFQSIVKQSEYLKDFSQNNWMWTNVAFLLGGLWLLYKKVIQWQIPLALLVTLAVISASFHFYSPDKYAGFEIHLLSGATMLGAFFIATDPVTSSTTPMGKLFFGANIAVFIYIIRVWGNYPDAIAFSILIMNMSVPLIDYYTQPRTFGHKSHLVKKDERND